VLACPDAGLGDAIERILHHHAAELAPEGLEIRRVADGLTCLQDIQLMPPSLLILHAGLERMGVAEILQAWDAAHPDENLPVIVLSAVFGSDVPRGMPGAVVVNLPFHNAELVALVARALDENAANS
jgi:DNA-binding response OmpR family regulator